MICINGHAMNSGESFCTQCGGAPSSPSRSSTVEALNRAPMPPQQMPSAPYVPPAMGYAPMSGAMGYAPIVATSGLAIASLVLGILGVSILAIIFGFVALSQVKKGKRVGRGLAISGLVLGFVWLALQIVLIIGAVATHSYSDSYDAGANYGAQSWVTQQSQCYDANIPSEYNQQAWINGCLSTE